MNAYSGIWTKGIGHSGGLFSLAIRDVKNLIIVVGIVEVEFVRVQPDNGTWTVSRYKETTGEHEYHIFHGVLST